MRHAGDGHSTQFSVSESDSDRAYFTDGIFQFALKGSNEQMSLSHNRSLSEEMDLTVGLDVDEKLRRRGLVPREVATMRPMFVNLRRAGESTTLSAAVRSDDNEDSPLCLSAPYALTETGLEGVAFKAAYGTGFRAPLLTRSALTNHPLRSPQREITR